VSPESVAEIAAKIRAFYESYSFPGYESSETLLSLSEKARKGVYASVLDEQLPLGVKVLDAGCGTGQLAIFLSATHRQVVGADFSFNSLRQGNQFKKKWQLSSVDFVQMDLLQEAIREQSFDFIFCNGVLHHTGDPYRGFQNLCRLLKPGGFITIGLYNSYGRLFTNLRRLIFKLTGNRLQRLDYYMRQKSMGHEKKRIWFLDSYCNPHDDTSTVAEVLEWFKQNDIAYVNSIPRILLGESFMGAELLFEPHAPGSPVEHLLCQLKWIFTQGKEGGFFLTIGRKN
jgi:ubiquinone/menaquinone biosynthesis C-methylase UbiE